MPIRCTRDASDELSRVAHAVARQYRQGVQKRKLVSHLSEESVFFTFPGIRSPLSSPLLVLSSSSSGTPVK